MRDITGSYLNAYLIAGGFCAAGVVLTLILAASSRRHDSREDDDHEPEVTLAA